MLRRQSIPYDDEVRPQYGTPTMMAASPRKWTTFSAPTSYNTIRYMTGDILQDYDEHPGWVRARDWRLQAMIGKFLIPWSGGDVSAYMRMIQVLKLNNQYEGHRISRYIHEYEVAKMLRGYEYRIIFVRDGQIVSKLGYNYKPAEANLFVDPTNWRIVDVRMG